MLRLDFDDRPVAAPLARGDTLSRFETAELTGSLVSEREPRRRESFRVFVFRLSLSVSLSPLLVLSRT